MIIIAAIFGTSILRDFQRDTYQMLFTKPISKGAYLGGRWAGSFVTTVFAFSGMMVGTWLGTFAPWADHARIGPNHLWWYLQPFLSINVIQIFFLGSLFFAVAALTRKIFVVYLQGVALFMIYLVGLTAYFATRSLEHFWSGILDPIGLVLFDNVARYWTVIEKNTLLVPWDFSGNSPGVFLYNRLLWTAVGVRLTGDDVGALPNVGGSAHREVAGQARGQGAAAGDARRRARSGRSLPRACRAFTSSSAARTTFIQYLSLTRLRVRTILREIPFWAIVGLLIVFAINNGQFAGRVGRRRTSGPSPISCCRPWKARRTLFFYIVATLYAGELIWRERDAHFDGIHDALPMGEARGLALEAHRDRVRGADPAHGHDARGHRHADDRPATTTTSSDSTSRSCTFVTFPQLIGFAMLALFVQTIVSNKFIGHGIVIGIVRAGADSLQLRLVEHAVSGRARSRRTRTRT